MELETLDLWQQPLHFSHTQEEHSVPIFIAQRSTIHTTNTLTPDTQLSWFLIMLKNSSLKMDAMSMSHKFNITATVLCYFSSGYQKCFYWFIVLFLYILQNPASCLEEFSAKYFHVHIKCTCSGSAPSSV